MGLVRVLWPSAMARLSYLWRGCARPCCLSLTGGGLSHTSEILGLELKKSTSLKMADMLEFGAFLMEEPVDAEVPLAQERKRAQRGKTLWTDEDECKLLKIVSFV